MQDVLGDGAVGHAASRRAAETWRHRLFLETARPLWHYKRLQLKKLDREGQAGGAQDPGRGARRLRCSVASLCHEIAAWWGIGHFMS